MIDTNLLKQNVDLISLAATVTTLNKEGPNERSGPCPKCGGDDRFHVNPQGFFCRQCKIGPASTPWFDAIEFNRWLYGDTFKQSVKRLSSHSAEALPPVKQKQPRPFDARYFEGKIQTAHDYLCSGSGKVGQDYLHGRRLDESTWVTYRLGFDPSVAVPATDGKERTPAISIPWYIAGQLVGLRYRFLERQGSVKQAGRGSFIGKLFGSQTLDTHFRTLVICEGELNACSIYQVAGHTRLDVLSFGSQSQSVAPEMTEHAARYDHVILWMDEKSAAVEKIACIHNCTPFAPEKDANDLLQSGELGITLSALRLQIAKQKGAVQLLYADLQYGADTLIGIDDGTQAILETL